MNSGERLLVSVIIPCFNCAATIDRVIQSLRRQVLPPGIEMEVIVVDNGSGEPTRGLLGRLPVKVVREARRGPAAARNRGIREAGGEIIVFVDADARPTGGDFIARHVGALRAGGEMHISAGAISPDPEQPGVIALIDNWVSFFNWHDRLPPRPLVFHPAANLACWKKAFEVVGLFNEDLLWLEDFDWGERAGGAGFRIWFNPEAGVRHWGRTTLRASLGHSFSWGLNIYRVYAPRAGNPKWLWPDRPLLFLVNVPYRVALQTYIVFKRWCRFQPFRSLLWLPFFVLHSCAWGAGVAVGALRRGLPQTSAQGRAAVAESSESRLPGEKVGHTGRKAQ